MTKEKVINVDYFSVNDKKNSIIENTSFQDNEITKNFNKIESLSESIKNSLSKKDKRNNIDNSINFNKKK